MDKQNNNPYSYKPGGFIPSANHGSTLEDKFGNIWHTSSIRISINHIFERRLGLWPAGFTKTENYSVIRDMMTGPSR